MVYGRTLLKLADETRTFAAVPGILGVVENPSELQQRIQMIATFRHRSTQPMLTLVLMATLGALFLTDAATPEGPHPSPRALPSTDSEVDVPVAVRPTQPEPYQLVVPPAPVGHAEPYSRLMTDGRLLYEMGNVAEAEQKFRQAKGLRPDDPGPDHYLRLIADREAATPLALDRDWVPTRPTSPATADGLETRIYRINPYTFEEGFDSLVSSISLDPAHTLGPDEKDSTPPGTLTSRDTSPSSRQIAERLRTVFRMVGVSFDPPSPNVFMFKPSTGILMVRASAADLDRIQQALEFINSAPAQITLEVKLVEIAPQDTRELGFDWFIGNTLMGQGSVPGPAQDPTSPPESAAPGNATGVFPFSTQTPAFGPPTTGRAQAQATDPRVAGPGGIGLTGILTAQQFQTVIRALENRGAVETAFAPRVTTLSDRQTRISVQNALTVDLLPVVLADGFSIDLTLKLQIARKFFTPGAPTAADSQQLEISTKAVVWDGQTLVLGGIIPSTSSEPNRPSAERTRKNLVVFITPTIVDPAGNPIHTPDALPYDPNVIRR